MVLLGCGREEVSEGEGGGESCYAGAHDGDAEGRRGAVCLRGHVDGVAVAELRKTGSVGY